LADAGLVLRQIVDPDRDREPPADAPPGSWTHESAYVGAGFVILATKGGDS
jgi:hypothetical protein